MQEFCRIISPTDHWRRRLMPGRFSTRLYLHHPALTGSSRDRCLSSPRQSTHPPQDNISPTDHWRCRLMPGIFFTRLSMLVAVGYSAVVVLVVRPVDLIGFGFGNNNN
jgi:hypothetical protein